VPAILRRLSILFTNYILRDLDNTRILSFLSVTGCQTCMCKRNISLFINYTLVIFVLKVGRPGLDSLAEPGQKTLKVGIHSMGVGNGGQGGSVGPWIFIDSVLIKWRKA